MKAKLEFDLPEDSADLESALKGTELAMFQESVFSKIRDMIKYSDITEDQEKILEKLRDELREEEVEITERY